MCEPSCAQCLPQQRHLDSGIVEAGTAAEVRKAGAPVARAVKLSESPDSLLTAGLWDCTAGTFTWIFGTDEIVHILEGEVVSREE